MLTGFDENLHGGRSEICNEVIISGDTVKCCEVTFKVRDVEKMAVVKKKKRKKKELANGGYL